MSKIFKPNAREGWEWALPVRSADNLTIVENFGRPLGATWMPIQMEVLRQDDRGRPQKEADMPWMGGHLLILRPRAVSALRDLCLEAGELLPLRCADAELVAWNVTTVVDALDKEKSKLRRFPSSGRVMLIREHYFKPEVVEGLTAFRIPEMRTNIFVGTKFVERVKEAGLSGAQFKEVWRSI